MPDPVGVALHVRWGRRSATTDSASLDMLKVVVSQLTADGRDVILLNAGVIGWLAIAWGAAGWTAGLSRSSWSDEGRVPARRAKGSTNKEWFFEHSLLHWVERPQHDRLRASAGYKSCKCAFCSKLNRGAGWSPAAQQHNLYALARLADQSLDPTLTGRRAKVRAILRRADRNWQACSAGTILNTQRRAAPHLALWRSVA